MADDTTSELPETPPTAGRAPGEEAPTDETGSVMAARIEPVVIEDEMKSSYMDYAMSVIVGRALPDVRDGLKPVHRRILHAMDEGGLRPNRPYRKCASAVGDVMKKYHPHGDTAIYDALVRMGQDFSSRYMLVDGHGNFGSIDGDPAAAMRYTEARLSELAMELLADIDEDTVDFVPNYDGYEQEPVVLPARFPHLLANGATGIAVGMATNIPPHNLSELIDATIALIDDPELDAVDLMEYVPAPDFPTGGLIVGRNGSFEAYTTGRGSVKVRAVCTIEEAEGRQRIVVSEIPFMVNKSTLLQKIAELVNNRIVEGIADLRDESARGSLRVVIDCKRDANPQIVLNQLYKHTQLQDTFGANMLALVDGVPKTLTLDEILRHYVDHQREVIRRRTSYRLRKARERAHVLEGLLTALEHLDAVIELIRSSESAQDARSSLMASFELSETQAQAILDMQLRRLAALERQKIADEYDDLQGRIATYEDILGDPGRVRSIIKEELTEIRATYGDERRSRIIPDDGEMTVEDLIPEGEIVLTLTRDGYVKRTPVDAFSTQRRGGRGVRGAQIREDDLVSQLITCSTHDHLLFFTNQGRVYRVKAYQVPEKSRDAKGVYVANVPGLDFEEGEWPAAVMSLSGFDGDIEQDGSAGEAEGHPDGASGGQGRYVVFATRQGTVKRTALEDFDSPRSVLIAISLREGDELVGVGLTHGDDEIMLVSRRGHAIRFPESEVRPMGRTAAGVRGMNLGGDEVLAMEPVQKASDHYLLVVTEEGYGKRTPVARYPVQGRGGKGVVTAKLTDDKGELAGALIVPWEAEMLMVSDTGTVIRMDVADVRPMGRNTQGVRLMRPDDGASVAGVALVVDDGVDDESDESAEDSGADDGDEQEQAPGHTAGEQADEAGADDEP